MAETTKEIELDVTKAKPVEEGGANITAPPALAAPQQPPAQAVPPQQPIGQPSQIDLAFQNLTPSQRNSIGSLEDFTASVQERQKMGASEDSSIGSIITESNETVEPRATIGTDKAQEYVDQTQADLDKRKADIAGYEKKEAPIFEGADQGEIKAVGDELDKEFQTNFDMLEKRKATLDERGKTKISSIQSSYDKRRAEMKTFNQNRAKSLEILGSVSGRQQYAGQWQTNILNAEELEGIKRLDEISAEEDAAINGVEEAMKDNDFELMQQQFDLSKEKRREKQEQIDKLEQLAIQQEQLMIQKQGAAREDAKFLLDYDKFQELKDNNKFNEAMQVAELSGQRVKIDENGNVEMLPKLTFDNQIKLDTLKLNQDRFGLDETIRVAQLELQKDGHQLNIVKFNQDIIEFGIEQAVVNENLRLAQQDQSFEFAKAGLDIPLYDLNLTAPTSDIINEMGTVISSIDSSVVGANGTIRPGLVPPKTGWECAEYAEQIVDLGTPGNVMGDLLSEKIANIERYGLTAEEVIKKGGFAVGDVIITDASDISSTGEALKWGHVAVISGIDANGNLVLQEANAKGDGVISSGRTIAPGDKSIQGVLGRRIEGKSSSSAGIKPRFFDEATINASQNVFANIEEKIENELDEPVDYKWAADNGVSVDLSKREAVAEVNYNKNKAQMNILDDFKSLATELKEHTALERSVGWFDSKTYVVRPESVDFEGKFDKLVNNLTLLKTPEMKGSISNYEMQTLSKAATALRLEGSEENFIEQLDVIINNANLKADLLTGIDEYEAKQKEKLGFEKYDPNNPNNIIEQGTYTDNWDNK